VSVGITVSSGALSLPENIYNMNGIVLKWTYGACWHIKESSDHFFFDEDIITSTSFLDKIKKTVPEFNNNKVYSSIGWLCTHSFCSHWPWLFEYEFPRLMDRKRRTSCVAPLFSWSYTLGFFLWSCVKDQVYSQSVNMLDELKAWITAAIAGVQRICYSASRGDCRWDVCIAIDGVHCCFIPSNFSTCV
jgi:hypothetical protein